MPFSTSLLTLAHYLAGEFENREQAIADPVWYVSLRLWHRPVPLFAADSITLFAEQVNIYTPENPYRQRLLRLQQDEVGLWIQYYRFLEPEQFKSAGADPQKLARLEQEQVECLPGCILRVEEQPQPSGQATFVATPPPGSCCTFPYNGETRQVALGFETNGETFLSYDRGIDPTTGKAIWGAILGPYQFRKMQDFSQELQPGA